MTDQQLRIAIAEACGINPSTVERGNGMIIKVYGDADGSIIDSPDYPTSLDAIQAAVLSMPVEFQGRFCSALARRSESINKPFYQLTSRDWCEAFVAALEP